MILFGVIVVALGALAIVLGVFTADVTSAGRIEIGGVHVTPVELFLVGLGAGVAVWWGFAIVRFGSKRSLARRRDRKRLTELSEQLDKVDPNRRAAAEAAEEKERDTL